MKKLILLVVLHHALLLALPGQTNFYVVAGVSPESHPSNAHLFVNRRVPADEFLFNMTQVHTQYYGGLLTSFDLNEYFFVETGTVFTQRKTEYTISYTYLREKNAQEPIMETENQLILPLSIGVRLKAVELQSGFDAVATLSRESDLDQVTGFENNTSALHFGWHAGVDINLGLVLLGLEYQAYFTRACEGMTVNDQSLALMNVPGQVKFNLKYRI